LGNRHRLQLSEHPTDLSVWCSGFCKTASAFLSQTVQKG
jgi:hypothetical protein